MEFRAYAAILRRRWWLPVLLAVLTLVLTLASQRPWQPRPPTYVLTLSFSVGVQPQQLSDEYTFDGYYTALSSEYLIDDFSVIVRGSEFAAAVASRLAGHGIAVPAGAIQGSAQTGAVHRILQVSISGGDPARLEAIADAVVATMTEDIHLFMPRLLAEQGRVYLVDRGPVAAVGPGLRQRLDLPLRLALALLAGLGLVFWLEYTDTRIYQAGHLEALGIPVLGEIPRKHRRPPWRRTGPPRTP